MSRDDFGKLNPLRNLMISRENKVSVFIPGIGYAIPLIINYLFY